MILDNAILTITTFAIFEDYLSAARMPPHISKQYIRRHSSHMYFAVATFTDKHCNSCGSADDLMLAYWPNEWSRPSAGSRSPTGSWYGINCSRCTASGSGIAMVMNSNQYRVVFDNNCDFIAFETRVHSRALLNTNSVDGFCACCRCAMVTNTSTCARCREYLMSLLQIHQAVIVMCGMCDVPRDISVVIMRIYVLKTSGKIE